MYTNNYTCGFCESMDGGQRHTHSWENSAELRRSFFFFAKALVRHNGPKNAVPSRLVASCVAQLAASPCESSLIGMWTREMTQTNQCTTTTTTTTTRNHRYTNKYETGARRGQEAVRGPQFVFPEVTNSLKKCQLQGDQRWTEDPFTLQQEYHWNKLPDAIVGGNYEWWCPFLLTASEHTLDDIIQGQTNGGFRGVPLLIDYFLSSYFVSECLKIRLK